MNIVLTDKDDGGHVRAHVGDVLEIHLGENATTGYRWEPDSPDPRAFEVSENEGSYRANAVGSGGEAQFMVKVLTPGSATLRLKNWRRWEGEQGIIQRFSVTVDAS